MSEPEIPGSRGPFLTAIIKYSITDSIYADGSLVFRDGQVYAVSIDKFEVLAAFSNWLTNTRPEVIFSMLSGMDADHSMLEHDAWSALDNLLTEHCLRSGVTT